jgi:CMP-2-keto-3-deoxyoctulosonic acid synthetase
VLRATARAVRGAPSALGVRLYRAADTLEGVVALAICCLERIEQLEQELRHLLGGGQ